MRNLILAVLLSSLSLGSLAGEQADKHMNKMIKKLDLNAQQSEQLQAIIDGKAEERKALHEQMKALRAQTNSEIEAILTPEQLEKFQQFQQQRQHKMKKHDDHKGRGDN